MPRPFNPAQNGVTVQNGEQPIRLPNGLLYLIVGLEQRTHSGDERCFYSLKNTRFLYKKLVYKKLVLRWSKF